MSFWFALLQASSSAFVLGSEVPYQAGASFRIYSCRLTEPFVLCDCLDSAFNKRGFPCFMYLGKR